MVDLHGNQAKEYKSALSQASIRYGRSKRLEAGNTEEKPCSKLRQVYLYDMPVKNCKDDTRVEWKEGKLWKASLYKVGYMVTVNGGVMDYWAEWKLLYNVIEVLV